MATSNLAIRFTEEKYATKSEVAKDLKIHFVDNIWSSILSYRANYNRYLGLYTIENKNYVFCNCTTIEDAVNKLNFKLHDIVKELQKMPKGRSDEQYTTSNFLSVSLKHVAKSLDLDVTKEYLLGIIRGDIKVLSASHKVLNHYLDALKYIQNNYLNNINEDFLAKLYSCILGTDELISFYRTAEDKAPENRVIIDRVYTAAPVKLIGHMMHGLFDFINNGQLSPSVKAFVTYYYINYVKPFPEHNDEIALLMTKAILSHYELGEYGSLIPLERLLISDLEKIATLCVEVQKTSDITYFVKYGIELVNAISKEMLDKIAEINVTSLKEDFYKSDDAISEPTYVQPQVVESKEVVEETRQQPKVETIVIAPQEERIAVSFIPKAIDEKEAYRLEKHLLELDPLLKKGQAKFYARHCTLGKKYTIQQYKKYNGCAYETARTSMDHLAELGYYRKEQVKNKFVYAPIPRQ